MKKLFPIFKLVGRVLMFVLLISSVLTFLATAYIVLVPDRFPKPFYLMYYVPTPVPTPIPEQSSILEPPPAHAAPAEHASISPEDVEPGQGIMIDTGTKIVNLAEPGGRKYIRVNIVLEFVPTDDEYYSIEEEEERLAYEQTFQEEVNTRLPVVNDIMITLLSSKQFEDVYTAEGKEMLREQILEMLNTKLPEYRVIFVYFTEFVVQ